MKHNYLYLFLALCIGAMVMSCKPKNEAGETEYIFFGSYQPAPGLTDSAVNEQSEIILKAFRNVGFSDKYELVLAAPDSAAVSLLLADKMKLVFDELVASPVKVKAKIIVKGREKKYHGVENDKEHPVGVFFRKSIGVVGDAADFVWEEAASRDAAGQFVKAIRTEEWACFHNDHITDYSVRIGDDTNMDAGGDYIYLWFDLSGKTGDGNSRFLWEEEYADQYITDVICIYGGGEPQEITIDGRRYHKANRVADLNKNAHGEYVYLYTTTDPVKGYENYYLNAGVDWYCHNKNASRMVYCENHDFKASDYLAGDWYDSLGHRFTERVVQAYKTDGTYVGEMDTNKGHGGAYCRFIFTYAEK